MSTSVWYVAVAVIVEGGGFLSNLAQGFAFGAGSAVAHEYRAVHGAVEAVKGRGSDNNQGGDVAAERQAESDAMPVSGYTTSSDKANQEVWVVLQFDL